KDAVTALRSTASPELQPTITAALCLMGNDCTAALADLEQTLVTASATDDRQPLLRGAVHALGMLARGGHDQALQVLFRTGVAARDSARAPIALGVGLVALRDPALMLRALEASQTVEQDAALLADSFDMLNEVFEEERFYAAVRERYWSAPAGSVARHVAEVV